MAISAPRRLLGKLRRVLLSDLPNCVCPLEFSGQYRVNFVCRYSIRPVSGYALPERGFDSRTNPFEEQGNDEDRGHDNEADAHELGSRTREEGAKAQDLRGLHVPSGPITRAKAKQSQQAIESLLMGFLGQEESNSIGSPNAFIQMTCHEMLKME
ncbi:hypothetical protein CRG98_020557 [Punica granatum]|uniref:Uncharacterized protein n=1 Tax=Punica granatum TaxID=22663 RepID=A0A2I0JRW9_PUNGR|nr:hypothetical protein CRG98_020557 [Punica granatum]